LTPLRVQAPGGLAPPGPKIIASGRTRRPGAIEKEMASKDARLSRLNSVTGVAAGSRRGTGSEPDEVGFFLFDLFKGGLPSALTVRVNAAQSESV